jgi:uncharacterized membrane protein YkoI
LVHPLGDVLPTLREAAPGQLLEVNLRARPDGVWVYEFVVLSPAGQYREVLLDAKANRVLGMRNR